MNVAWKIDGTSRTAFLYRKLKRNVLAVVLDWCDFWSKPALVAKSRQAERRLRLCNESVDEARLQLVVQQINRARSARKSAEAVVEMLIATEAAQQQAEQKRASAVRKLTAENRWRVERAEALVRDAKKKLDHTRESNAESEVNLQIQHKGVRDQEKLELDAAFHAVEMLSEYIHDDPTVVASLDLTEEDL